MASQPNTLLSVEEYLDLELRTEYKNEYLDGEVFAMAGGLFPHVRIAANLIFGLRSQLGKSQCEAVGEVRVRTEDRRAYLYPDLVVFCEKRTWKRLVSQERVLVERFLRRTNGEWVYSSVHSLEDSLNLVAVPATLKLSEVYERVFPEVEEQQ